MGKLFTTILAWAFAILCTFGQNYGGMWRDVERLKQEGRPRSAMAEAERLRKVAEENGSFAWALKASMAIVEMRGELSPDSVDANGLRVRVKDGKTDGRTERTRGAIVHALLSSTYSDLSSRSWRNAEQRSEYMRLAEVHKDSAMADWDVLANASAKEYEPLFAMKGEDSRLYGNDMLSVIASHLADRTITGVRERHELYDSLSCFYTSRGNRDGGLLMGLKALECRVMGSGERHWGMKPLVFRDSVLSLARGNKDIEAGADAFLMALNYTPASERRLRRTIVDEAIEAYPQSGLRGVFERARAQLDLKVLRAVTLNRAPNPLVVEISHYGVEECKLSFYHHGKQRMEKEMVVALKKKDEPTKDTIEVALAPGNYRMAIEDGKLRDTTNLSLTSLMAIASNVGKGKSIITVVDGQDGTGKKGVEVSLKGSRKKSTEGLMLMTNKWGQASFEDIPSGMSVRVDGGNHDIADIRYLGRFWSEGPVEDEGLVCGRLFTDRAIYRPGQKVNVSAIVYNQRGDTLEALPGKKITIKLLDANREEMGSRILTTNVMGSASTEFTLPASGLNGVYELSCGNGVESALIRVEEYKRPTFLVDITNTRTEYAFGDTIRAEGSVRTFSGAPVQNAKVRFKLQCRNTSFWFRYGGSWKEVESGDSETDNEGRFCIPIFMDIDQMDADGNILEYLLHAEVTNGSGETQQGSLRLAVSENTFGLNAEVEQVVLLDSLKKGSKSGIGVKAMDMGGKEVERECRFEIYRLGNKKGANNSKPMMSGKTMTGMMPAQHFTNLGSGDYKIVFEAIDTIRNKSVGKERLDTVRTSAMFTLFSPKERSMDVAKDFVYSTSDEISEGHPVDVYFMPEHKNVTLYWFVMANDSLIDHGMRLVDDKLQRFRMEYKAEYGDGLSLSLFYVKDYAMHRHIKLLPLKMPDKSLTMEWKTFRDNLVPGQKETWTLSVRDAKGKGVDAEVMATMFDASLDQIAKHNWRLGLGLYRNVRNPIFVQSDHYGASCNIPFTLPRFNIKYRTYNTLPNVLPFAGMAMGRSMSAKGSVRYNMVATMAKVEDMDATIEESAPIGTLATKGGSGEEEGVKSSPNIRENFAETAFFHPHIMTDKNGEATFSFTLPESLTEWRFMGLAHTSDMKYGKIEDKIVASKGFMVQPNMPRFVRMGDKVTITSNIINRTDSTISGETWLTLLDPQSESIIRSVKKNFNVGGKQTLTVDFTFEATENHPLLICQIEAQSTNFSDGERNMLPVLSNKELITTTLPFYIEDSMKTINIADIFNYGSHSATDRKITIGYYANPAWMAIEALRSVAVPETDNAISISASLYANIAAQHLAKQIPGIKTASGNKSPLEANQELKNIILKESPWLSESIEESDGMNRLAELLDEAEMGGRMRKAENKLEELQNADGSWSWFEGMRGSKHITTQVVEHIAEAERLTGMESSMHSNMLRAMEWLDKEELRNYEKTKRGSKKSESPSESTLRYLYVSSLVERKLPSAIKAMQNDYLNKAEKSIGGLTIYGRANIACVLEAHGRNDKAKDFVESLREYTVFKPGLGRYYDTDHAYYSWCDYRMPSHLTAMKAMRQQASGFDDTKKYINDMTLWLIQQKRTQGWDNPINTIGVVNELLTDSLINSEKTEAPEFIVNDDKKLITEQPVGNVGYTKVTISDDGANNLSEFKTLVIKDKHIKGNTSKLQGLKWGAVYGQCLEDINNINSASTEEISISKKMYVERNANGKSTWKEVGDDTTLKVGDKVRIRYTLTTDRDMDFIQVRAQHPACFEPLAQLSGYRWLGTHGAYVAQHDASTDFFFDTLRKGSLTFDQEMYVNRIGTYTSGSATAQCAYCPDFSARTNGSTITIQP